jgi:hypothetical protein
MWLNILDTKGKNVISKTALESAYCEMYYKWALIVH